MLAYKLICTVMAQAAGGAGVAPRTISFKGTLRILGAFRPLLAFRADRGPVDRESLYRQLLRAIATQRVGYRPDRFEPRMVKRRTKGYPHLSRLRQEIKIADSNII